MFVVGQEAIIEYYRDTDERFTCARNPTVDPAAAGRLAGIPTLAWLASILDPRVKSFNSFLTDGEVEGLWYRLQLIMVDTAQEAADIAAAEAETDEESSDNEAPRRRRQLREGETNDMVASVVQFATPDRRRIEQQCLAQRDSVFTDEINRYRLEPSPEPTSNPMLWWKKHHAQCPNIAREARKYLPVQCTNGSAERKNSELSLLCRQNRSSLSTEIINDITILRGVFRFLDDYPDMVEEFRAME